MIKKYTQLVCVIIAFFCPILISYLLYYNHEYFNLKTAHHGVLINPPIDVKTLWQSTGSNQWQIVHVTKNACDSNCEDVANSLNQIKKALGKNSERVSFKTISSEQKVIGKQDFSVENKIYLVDPAGNLFMYYADTENPMNILKDLNHVLEISRSA
jgi:cytochrome oxidase Cu insertion factor (SCO1/SenC/PrrC family)